MRRTRLHSDIIERLSTETVEDYYKRLINQAKGDVQRLVHKPVHSNYQESKMSDDNTSEGDNPIPQNVQLALNNLRNDMVEKLDALTNQIALLLKSKDINNNEQHSPPQNLNMSSSSSSTDVQLQVLQALNSNNLIKPFDGTNKSINIKIWFSNLERYFKLNGTISSEYFDYLLLKLDGEPLEIASQYDGNYFQVKKHLILLFDSNKSCISAERELDGLTRQIERIQDLDSNASKIKDLCRIIYQGKSGEERLKAQAKKLWSLLRPSIKKVTKLPMRYNDFDWDLFILDIKQSFEIDSAEYRERRFPNRNLKPPFDSHKKEKRCLNLGCKFPYNHDTPNCKMQKILKDHKSLPRNNLVMSDSPNNLLTSVEKECNTVFDKNECLESSQDDSDSDASLSDAPSLIYKSGKISNISVVIAIDSGSTFTSISDNLQYLLKMPDKDGSEVPIKLIEGITAVKRAKGKRLLTIEGNSIYLKHPLIFNSRHHNFDILLGRDMLKKYGAIVDHTDGAINWSVTGKCNIKNTNSLNFLITPSKFSPTTHDDITFDDLKVFQYGIDVNSNEESKTYALCTESVIIDQDKQKYLDELIAASDKHLREKFPSVFIVNDSQIVPTMVAEEQRFNFTEQNKNYKTYGLSYHNQSIALQLAKIWEDAGIIEEGEPDNGITHPVILIDKQKDSSDDNKNVDITSRYRLVCDFRCINEFTHKHCEISMNITNSILINRPFVFCSKLDFKTAYGQIKLHPSNTRSFNITIGHKKFNYLTLPQGARNSATLFKIVMMNLFQDLFEQQHLQWYHDDMLIMTHADSQSPLTIDDEIKKAQEHCDLLELVFQRMEARNVKVSQIKSQLFQKSVSYLGFTLTRTGWRPSIQSVNRILNRGRPDSRESLRRFLYASNYFSICIPNFSVIASPLYDLINTKSKQKFVMQPHHLDAYHKIARSLCDVNHKLYFGDPNADYIIRVDASSTGIGGSISQNLFDAETNTIREIPLGFVSFRLPKVVRRRSSTYLELKGIASVLEYYKFLLENCPGKIRILTDHKPLEKLRYTASMSKHVELLSHIDKFNCIFEYSPGKLHFMPDWLSRIENEQLLRDDESGDDEKGYDDSNEQFNSLTCLLVKRSRGRPRVLEEKNNEILIKRKVGRPRKGESSPTKQCHEKVNISNKEKGHSDDELNIVELNEKDDMSNTEKNDDNNEIHITELNKKEKFFLYKMLRNNILFSIDELKMEQEKDDNCQRAVKSKYFLNYDVRVNNNGIIQICKTNLEKGKACDDKNWKTLIPLSLAEKVIKMAHNQGHYSFIKTLSAINYFCFIPQPGKMIKKILNNCNTCLIRNSGHHHQPSNKTIDLSCYPFDRLSMDLITPRTIDQICHHKYILVVCDECTKYVWVLPLLSKEGSEIIDTLIKYIFTKGALPSVIRTDGDGQFRGSHFTDAMKELGVKLELSTAYDSNSNAIVENKIKSVNKVIHSLTEDYPTTSFCQLLDLVSHFINNSRVIGMQMTPVEMMFGISPRTTLSNILDHNSTLKYIDRSDNLNEWLNSITMVRKILNDQYIQYRQNINNKKKEKYDTLKVGDTFYFRRPRKHKFDKNYTPHVVLKDLRTKVLYKSGNKTLEASKAKIKKLHVS